MENLLNPDEIHTWLSSLWPKSQYPNIIAGINDDDCAILRVEDQKIVITTDYLNANPISKQLGIATNNDLGALLVAANLSDLLGTGAMPIAFLSSIMMKKGSSLKDFKEIIEGIKSELEKYKIPLVGGDTKLGPATTLCGTAIGICPPDGKLFVKSNAGINDTIWVSGQIGNVGAAVIGLTNGNMSKEWEEWAKRILISPNLPFDRSLKLSKLGLGKAGTDISDGLGENLYDLCESSNLGATIYANKLPINEKVVELADRLNVPPWFFAFSIGGDFQFIVTTDKNDSKILYELGFVEIGLTQVHTQVFLDYNENIYSLPRLGHTDFNLESFAFEVQEMLNALKINLNDGKSGTINN